MSRTYRRTEKGQKRSWLPEIRRYDLVQEFRYSIWFKPDVEAIEWLKKNPHRSKDIDDWFYWMKTPSYWRRDYETKPRRARERDLCRKIIKGELDLDNVVYPLDRKPTVYYW